MSQTRPLTSAARPRPATPPAARRLTLYLLVFLFLAAGTPFAAAEMVYYTEDFCHDGGPGFDPMFSHDIIEPSGYPDYMYPLWSIRAPIPGLVDEYWLALSRGTKDLISFDLAEGERVTFASVVVAPEMSSLGYVKFIGTRGEWQTSQDQYGEQRFEVSYEELGYIQAIELSARQSGVGFTTVTIGVIPEPSTSLLVLCSVLLLVRRRC